jgi:exodeoxyribonuclease-3
MNITTWNVNSVRARIDRVLEWIDGHAPDVLCLQELKCQDAELPVERFTERGYAVESLGQKTYNGVAILSKLPMSDVVRAIPNPEDPQARGISARIGGIRIVNLYCPNGGELSSDKYPYKLDWYDRLLARLRPWAAEPLLVCGDFNIAPADADVYDPAGWKDQVLCSVPERDRFQALLALGLTDSWRHFHKEGGVFTWWDYRGDGFSQNRGLRIDHHLVTPDVLARATDVSVDLDARGRPQASDHAPVTLHLRDQPRARVSPIAAPAPLKPEGPKPEATPGQQVGLFR